MALRTLTKTYSIKLFILLSHLVLQEKCFTCQIDRFSPGKVLMMIGGIGHSITFFKKQKAHIPSISQNLPFRF